MIYLYCKYIFTSFFQIEEALNIPELFETPAMKAVINYNWHKFGRKYNFIKLLSSILYPNLFIIGISVRDDSIRKFMMSVALVCGAWRLLGSLLRFRKGIKYFASIYLIYAPILLVSTILSMIVASMILSKDPLPSGLVGTSMLLVYIDLVSNVIM